MRNLQIIYSKTAVKAIANLDKSMKLRVKNGIEGLLELPPCGDIKQIRGSHSLTYRLRIGKYRILYEFINIDGEQALLIKDIGSRGDIYK